MATGDASSPIRFGGGQVGVTNRELYLDVFGGEVYAAFDLATNFLGTVETKSVGPGQKSWRFPKTWKASSEYHTPGVELLGTDIDTTEVTVTIDDILVSHTGLSDIDTMLSHFDVRSKFSQAMGYELAKVLDKNIARQLILTARAAADGPFPGGNVISTDDLKATSGVYNGAAWIQAIRDGNETFFNADVPESLPRYLAVPWGVFDAIKYATDSNGNYLVLNRDFHGSEGAMAGGISGRAETMNIDGVTIFKTRNAPFGVDESADTSVYSKYRGDYTLTKAVMWVPEAVGCVKMKEIGFEQTRDTRRLEDFMVASMLAGLGTLRPEGAIELKSAT